MKPASRGRTAFSFMVFSVLVLLLANGHAQTCQTSSELDDATRTAITTAAQHYYDMAARGDTASLRQNSIPSLASDFAGIETTVKDHQPELGGPPNIKAFFLLDESGPTPNPHAEFYCGVFGRNGQTANSAAFYLDNLPPAKYAVVLIDASSTKGRAMFSEVLQQLGTEWKLGGLYIKSAQIAGHDSDWFLARAREYKAKGELHNAWFYFQEGRALMSPLPFMSTLATDKLYDESQGMLPADMPSNGKTVDLATSSAVYKLTAVFPEAVGNDLDLIVKYQSANVANTTQAYQDNIAVIKALVTKYPEVREAFAGVVARAVDASGHDYGTLLAMKDIK